LKTLCLVLFNSVLSFFFFFVTLEFCKHANWIMLFLLCIQFATCPLPRLFFKLSHMQNFLHRSFPPGRTTTMPVSTSGKLLLQPHPYSLLASPASRSNNNPSLTQPAAGPPPHSRQHPHNLATPSTTRYHNRTSLLPLVLSRPTRLQRRPNLNNNHAGECELWYTSVAINSGASVPQSVRAYSVLEQLYHVNDIPSPRNIVLQYIWVEQGA
jgi:hypothetical protein